MKEKRDTINELKRQKRELESAFAQEHLRNIVLEGLIEAAEFSAGSSLGLVTITILPFGSRRMQPQSLLHIGNCKFKNAQF
jgi:hypothetical protein